MDIVSGKTGLIFFFFYSPNELNSLTYEFWFVSCWYKYSNAWWMEITGDMFVWPKLKDISLKTSTLWKGHPNRIRFQTKNDVMMEPDRITFGWHKTRNCNSALLHLWPMGEKAPSYDLLSIIWQKKKKILLHDFPATEWTNLALANRVFWFDFDIYVKLLILICLGNDSVNLNIKNIK